MAVYRQDRLILVESGGKLATYRRGTCQEVDVRLDIHNSDVPLLCRGCEARHRGVCGALNVWELTHLARQTKRQEIAANTTLMASGVRAERYANILSGVVKLSKLTSDGRQQIVGLQFAPDLLGQPLSESVEINAEAAGVVHVCSFPRSTLERMMRESPDLVRRLHEQTLRELDEARGWMLTVGRKTALEKVASFLLLLARNVDPERHAAARFDIPLCRSDIADFLGLTIETVSRQLSRLRRDGIVKIERRRRVTVADYAELKIASGD